MDEKTNNSNRPLWGREEDSKFANHRLNLTEANNYLNSLIKYASAPIIIWDPELRIQRFNRAFENLTGYEAKEVIEQDLSILFSESTREDSLRKVVRSEKGEHWESVDIPIQCKDGTKRDVLWNSANIYADDDETLIATIAQGVDVTERKKAEEQLTETKDYLDSLIEYASAPIITWDPQLRIRRFNRAFEDLTGYEAKEVIEQDLSILFSESTRKDSLRKVVRSEKGEHWESVDIPIQCKDGTKRDVLWNSANIYADDDETLVATIAQGVDVTERKKVEKVIEATNQQLTAANQQLTAANQQLRASEEDLKQTNQQLDASNQQLRASEQQQKAADHQLKAQEQQLKVANQQLNAERDKLTSILETMTDGAYIVNKGYDIQYINPVLKKEFGCVEGRKCYRYFHDSDEPCTFCKNTDVFAGKTVQWEWTSPKTRKTYDLIDTPIMNADGSISKLEIFRDITKRKQAEKRTSQFAQILEASLNEIYIFDAETFKFLQVNKGARDNLGYTLQECRELTPLDIKPNITSADFAELIEPLRTGDKEIIDLETVHQRKDGSLYDAELHLQLSSMESDPVYIAIVLDITDRKRAENVLKLSEERFRLLYEQSPIAYQSLDAEGCFIEVNPAWLSLLGYEEEVVGRSFADFLAKGYPELFKERFPRFKTAGEVHAVPFRMVHKDGHCIDVEIDGKVAYRPDGSFRQTHCVLHDVSERKKAESEIKALSMFPSENPNPVLRTTKDGEVLYSNEAGEQLLSKWESGIGKTVSEKWRNLIAEAFVSKEEEEEEEEVDGNIFSIVIAPVKEAGYANLYAHNITEMKNAQEILHRHQIEIAHMSRIVTTGEIASGLAHEINQPLCATENYANACLRMIRSNNIEPSDLENSLEQISKLTHHSGEIINRIKSMVERQEIHKTAINIHIPIQNTLSILNYEIKKNNIQVVNTLEEQTIGVFADLIMIEQVVLNLIRNAIEAMSEPTVKKRILALSADMSHDGQTELSIADTGVGISPEHLVRLFDPFFTTKTEGVGIGLAISQTIIEMHSGKLWAVQNPEGGTTMKFTLPVQGE